MVTNQKPTIAERGIVTSMLVDAMSKGIAELSYEELSRHAGADVCSEGRGNLSTAMRIVRREYGLCYITVRGVGLRLMTADKAAEVGMASVAKMHRESRRGMERMRCADISQLDNAQKVRFNAVASGLGAIALVTQPKSIQRLEKAVETSGDKLALASTLKAFHNGDE